jgi:isoleucyl-tRNA synthetase
MGALASTAAGSLASRLLAGHAVTLEGVQLGRDDVEVDFLAKDGFAAAGDRVGVVLLDTQLDDELRDLGLLRELQNRIQSMRKEMGLEYTDRVRLVVLGSERVAAIVRLHEAALAREILAIEIATGRIPAGFEERAVDLDGEPLTIGLARV